MFQPLDGPSTQTGISLTTTVVYEIGNGTPLNERKVITIQPLGGDIYVYFGDGVTAPSAATVAADGFVQTKNSKESYEASKKQPVYILSVSVPSNSVKIAERA